MPTFMSTLPRNSKTAPVKRPQRLKLFLKPTDPKGGADSCYRFRLLWFMDSTKNDRDYPFIVRYVHRVFEKNEEGKTVVAGEVVCPVTKFAHWDGNPYKDCKICNYSGRQFNEYNKSGKTDKDAMRKSREFSRKFEAWIPVYVVNDPVYETNNGKMMAFCFTDRKQYEAFDSLVKQTERESSVYNETAVDFFIKLGEVTKIINEGKPDERPWTTTEIKKMGFTKKEYSIPAITEQAISEFEFDDQLYIYSTHEDIDAFYDRFCKPQTVGDIPDDDLDMIDVSPKSEPDPPPHPNKTSREMDDDFGLGPDDDSAEPDGGIEEEEAKPVKKETPAKASAEAKAEEAKPKGEGDESNKAPAKKADSVSMEELDSLLDF